MTSVTTAVGIGSLATSPVESIHEFGVWAAIGILIAYLLVMTLLPIVLSFLPPPRVQTAGLGSGGDTNGGGGPLPPEVTEIVLFSAGTTNGLAGLGRNSRNRDQRRYFGSNL